MGFSQTDLVTVTAEDETVPGVVVGGARERVYHSGAEWSPSSSVSESAEITGDGQVRDVALEMRAVDSVTIPNPLVYGLHHAEWARHLRITTGPPAAVSVAGVSATFTPAGTHSDGSTGPVITAAAASFDDLVTASAVGAMMVITGAATGANNKPRRIKALAADGSQIDIDPLYHVGSAGEFGEPIQTEGPVSITIDIGVLMKAGAIPATTALYRNYEFFYPDQTSYQLLRGCRPVGGSLGFTGKGEWTQTFNEAGLDFDTVTGATAGNGTVNTLPASTNPRFMAGRDMTWFVVNGTTVLSGTNLTAFNLAWDGSPNSADDVAGNLNRACVDLGNLKFTGSLTAHHKQAITVIHQALARAGTAFPIDVAMTDPLGNSHWFGLPRVIAAPHGPSAGAQGSRAENQFDFKAFKHGDAGSFVWQAFPAA